MIRAFYIFKFILLYKFYLGLENTFDSLAIFTYPTIPREYVYYYTYCYEYSKILYNPYEEYLNNIMK